MKSLHRKFSMHLPKKNCEKYVSAKISQNIFANKIDFPSNLIFLHYNVRSVWTFGGSYFWFYTSRYLSIICCIIFWISEIQPNFWMNGLQWFAKNKHKMWHTLKSTTTHSICQILRTLVLLVHYQAKFSYYHGRISSRFKQCPHLCLGSPDSLVVQTITHNSHFAKHFVLFFTVSCSASEDTSCCRGGLGAHCDTRGVLRGKGISLLLLGIK